MLKTDFLCRAAIVVAVMLMCLGPEAHGLSVPPPAGTAAELLNWNYIVSHLIRIKAQEFSFILSIWLPTNILFYTPSLLLQPLILLLF